MCGDTDNSLKHVWKNPCRGEVSTVSTCMCVCVRSCMCVCVCARARKSLFINECYTMWSSSALQWVNTLSLVERAAPACSMSCRLRALCCSGTHSNEQADTQAPHLNLLLICPIWVKTCQWCHSLLPSFSAPKNSFVCAVWGWMLDPWAAGRSPRQVLSMQGHHTLQLHSGCGSIKTWQKSGRSEKKHAWRGQQVLPALGLKQ